MDQLVILAQAVSNQAAEEAQIVPIDYIWEQITSLSWLQALIAVSFGAVYLMYGWRIFKIMVVICFGLIGLFLGIQLSEHFGNMLWNSVIGLFLLAAISIPLMKWAVSALGAVAGGIITAGIWYAFELPEKYILAGAVIGIVAGGMISFIIFKIAIMLFSSLAGGILIVMGMLSLLYHYENLQVTPTTRIQTLVSDSNWFLPLVVIIPTAIGMLIQNKFIKTSSNYKL